MTTQEVLSEAFAQYKLELPLDVCRLVENHFHDAHLSCHRCHVELLNVVLSTPFVKNVPAYYEVFRGNVFTLDGMLSRISPDGIENSHALLQTEGVFTAASTPDTLNVCGVHVKNETMKYMQSNWYKRVDDIYLCSRCFMRKRNVRRFFASWKRRTVMLGDDSGQHAND